MCQWLWPPAANFVELQYNCLTDHRCTGWAWPAFRELLKVGASFTNLADDAGDPPLPQLPLCATPASIPGAIRGEPNMRLYQ